MVKKNVSIFFVVICFQAIMHNTVSAGSVNVSLRVASKAFANGDHKSIMRVENYSRSASIDEPRSALAHWLRAQSLFTMAGIDLEYEDLDKQFVDEAFVRSLPIPVDRFPANIIGIPKDNSLIKTVLIMETSGTRLFVYQLSSSGKLRLSEVFYASIGLSGDNKVKKGDQKTPLGVYRLIKEIKNPKKLRADGLLGRLAITLDYPNADDRKSGRTGYGIWIHGVPEGVHVREPRASDGCLALSNEDITKLRNYVRYGITHIIIVPKIDWIAAEEWDRLNDSIRKVFENGESIKMGAKQFESDLLGYFRVSKDRPSVALKKSEKGLEREYWIESPRGLNKKITERLQ